MKRSGIIGIAVGGLLLFGSGLVVAQKADPKDDSYTSVKELLRLEGMITTIEDDYAAQASETATLKDGAKKEAQQKKEMDALLVNMKQAADDLSKAYMKAGNDPSLSPLLVSVLIGSYKAGKVGDDSAPRATMASNETIMRLNAVQVAQNARIIELLQKIADKK